MIGYYTVMTNERRFAEKDPRNRKLLAASFENGVLDFIVGGITKFTKQPAFDLNNSSSFLASFGLSYSDLQAMVKLNCPEFAAGLMEIVVKESLVIDCYARKHNKKIYIYGGEGSNKNVVVHLSALEDAVHTNHFILHGIPQEIAVVKNLLYAFAKSKEYVPPGATNAHQRTGDLVKVDFKTGQREAAEQKRYKEK